MSKTMIKKPEKPIWSLSAGCAAGGARRSLGEPPRERDSDWAVLVRRSSAAQPLDRERNLQVKLRTPIGNRTSKPGDRVEASVVSPETYLGGTLEGVVESAGESGVRIVLQSLVPRGGVIDVDSTTRTS